MSTESVDLCIVGAGATGLCLLLLLQDAGHDMRRVAIVDPHFDGGDLARRWTRVQSNTPWSKTLRALQETCPTLSFQALEKLNPEESTCLCEIAQGLRQAAAGALAQVRQVRGEATQAEYSSSTRLWSITVKDSMRRITTVSSKGVVFAQGAEPRSLDFPQPSIPLEIGLDSARLSHYVRPGQTVLVVGTMHSGALILQNLVRDCSANAIGFYNTPTPFVWDRDGAYDGLKREAADAADAMVAGAWGGRLSLTHVHDTSGVVRAGRLADWVIYAMGFQTRQTLRVLVDGEEKALHAYNGETGAIEGCPRAWGFGVAYPNRAPDGIHWDVSVAAFLLHMKRRLAELSFPVIEETG
jgi:cation diffusion facilitator CzcD-associated flavoprotein CzcO